MKNLNYYEPWLDNDLKGFETFETLEFDSGYQNFKLKISQTKLKKQNGSYPELKIYFRTTTETTCKVSSYYTYFFDGLGKLIKAFHSCTEHTVNKANPHEEDKYWVGLRGNVERISEHLNNQKIPEELEKYDIIDTIKNGGLCGLANHLDLLRLGII